MEEGRAIPAKKRVNYHAMNSIIMRGEKMSFNTLKKEFETLKLRENIVCNHRSKKTSIILVMVRLINLILNDNKSAVKKDTISAFEKITAHNLGSSETIPPEYHDCTPDHTWGE
jgi:hypothetical protein